MKGEQKCIKKRRKGGEEDNAKENERRERKKNVLGELGDNALVIES